MSLPTRRHLGALLAAALPGLAPAGAATPDRKLKIVVTGGHPGDPEYGCGGTAARYAQQGHAVTFLYLNRGEKGCPEADPRLGSGVRVPEAEHACRLLKARPVFAAQCDGNAIVDAAHYEEFRRLLETEKPDVVFTHWPVDNHRDHRAAANLVYDAWLAARKSFALYFYEVSNGEDTMMFPAAEYVDITAVEPLKKAACYAHRSQSPDRYYALQDQVARFRGLECGFGRAEAFARHPLSPRGSLP
ncbi:MAG TPA: PIG-L deacetylase family protein [Paludibaculum sp.]|jgi:LmbE family N-acetylglucosaminyl deacetylase